MTLRAADDVALLSPESLDVVDRLRVPAPVAAQAWDATGTTLALVYPPGTARRTASLTLLDFRRARVTGPLDVPDFSDQQTPALVTLERRVALADPAGRRLVLLSGGGEPSLRTIPLGLAPRLLARSHDGGLIAAVGAPGEGIVVVEPESGAVVGRWGAEEEGEGLLGTLTAGPASGVWLVSEAVTGAVLLVAPGAAQPVRARWPAPAQTERGRLTRVLSLTSAPGSALIWALYGTPAGVAVFDVAAGRQVAWRRRMTGNLTLNLAALTLDPLGRCLYGVRPVGEGACEVLVMTPLMTRVSARLPLDSAAGDVLLAARPHPQGAPQARP